jgi:hypothetical protein
MEYQIEATTRKCVASGRELRAGERIFSVLRSVEGKFARQDYAPEVWRGPPADAFSFWASRVPAADEVRKPPIDDELLLDCFRRLQGDQQPDRIQFAYVVALLLLRRKRLKFEAARVEEGREVLRFHCPRSRDVFEAINPNLSDEEMASVQEEVFRVLGWE